MYISEIPDVFSANMVRDGEFLALGKTRHQLDGLMVFLESPRYLTELTANPHISCVITKPEIVDQVPQELGVLASDSPRNVFYDLHAHLNDRTEFYWKHFETEVDPTASVHTDAYVAPRDVRIGPGSVIGPRAVVLERTIIGEDVRVLPGATLSTEGYEVRRSNGRLLAVPHAGAVRLENGVHVFANSAIGRPIFNDYTVIGQDTKVDSLVLIGHNCKIGERCEIAGSAVVCGNVVMGDDVWVGPQACISNGLRIGNKAQITIGSLVVRDVAEGEHVTGFFAVEHHTFLKNWARSVG